MVSSLESAGFSHGSPGANRGTLRIAETFVSRQGEGKLTGVTSFFIRTSGCNLRCWFCDTPYASWQPEGEQQSIDKLVAAVKASGCQHVVLTGGEPLLPLPTPELVDSLRGGGMHVTIETAGTIAREVTCDLLSLSPKLSSSAPDATTHPRWHQRHEERRLPLEAMRGLMARSVEVQVKFVVDTPKDFPEIAEIVARLGVSPSEVWLMPQGTTPEALDASSAWLRPWCDANAFTYCDRMHIRWYGNRRGT